jgi:thiamine biosynthesis protein ThiS
MKKLKKIKIKVNGKIHTFIDKLTLYELINHLNIPVKKVAIELNKEIANKKRLRKIKLKNNDIIEIVHFIGGG